MKPGKKAKWIVGIAGTAFTAFVLGQLDDTPVYSSNTNNIGMVTEVNDSMSEREKELVQLDWSNFTLEQRADYYDFSTRRS
ncbi:hypothetical protein NST62_11620 [Ureibacillus sp. FSL K6-8385]|uniref:Uncharacterized protein n=1 Tax=Ureibacillus terrenus TaxID=118246 RepID=A0A540V3E5_9BACL|nr:hypothetical protein [Ureibacillus terrenus]MED3662861.1 hypothetical protein [Ureibacillus terrenus]MED3763845.1 hypothetical protein [Ureibacillus terrenus]TQE91261.1 hypothetical protein FKZ59_06360 [Ureibacillus terrenus]